jgi:hypothetical protein
MHYLADVFPFLRRIKKLPVSRDQLILLLAAINELFMGLDTYFAHVLNGTIRWNEWIPIIFGTAAGVLLLLAGLLAYRNRNLASLIGTVVFIASIVVGFMGSYFHLSRGGIQSYGVLAERLNISFLIWAPPGMAPLAFVLVGVLGMSAVWIEHPTNSGILKLPGNRTLRMPYSKTQAYFLMVCFGILVTLVSATLDHARTGFENPWLWLPLVVPIFAAVVSFLIALKQNPDYSDLVTYVSAMILMGLVGVLGFYFHVRYDLTADGKIVIERFLRGAPFIAPLLYANMAAMGLIVLLDPEEKEV